MTIAALLAGAAVWIALMFTLIRTILINRHHTQDEERRINDSMRGIVHVTLSRLHRNAVSSEHAERYMQQRGVPPAVRERVLNSIGADR